MVEPDETFTVDLTVTKDEGANVDTATEGAAQATARSTQTNIKTASADGTIANDDVDQVVIKIKQSTDPTSISEGDPADERGGDGRGPIRRLPARAS